MENNYSKKQNSFISEEEKTLNWEEIQSAFKKTFGSEIYNSWLQKISLVKEYNDYLVLGVPTRFFRDWIVSRYLDKILEQVKSFKLSLNRIEFKIIEENKQNHELIKIDELNKVTEIKDSIFFPMITGKDKGTGLGLSITQGIISQHKGNIHFTSEPNRTEFFINIPVNTQKDIDLKTSNG